MSRLRLACLSLLLLAAAPAASSAAETVLSDGYTCPRGLKFAAGACVKECPGGYEDTGFRCEYRRGGGGGGK